jgi:HEAT repeat protein
MFHGYKGNTNPGKGELIMPSLKQILIGVAVIVFLSSYNIIWYYIKRLIFKPDIQKLMNARDAPGLLRALSYKKDKYDFNYIRTNAAIALGNVGDEKAIDKLVERLNDIDRNVVKASIQTIGQITLRCVRQPMFQAYQNRDQIRIQSLVSTLQYIQSKATSPLVYGYRDSSELPLVISTLGIVSGPEAVEFLLNLVKDSKNNGVVKMAAQALASTGDPG